MDKYDPKGSFNDPIVRCFKCQKILKTETLKKVGQCTHCGGRKVSNVTIMNEEELEQIKTWHLDPDYVNEWEGIGDE